MRNYLRLCREEGSQHISATGVKHTAHATDEFGQLLQVGQCGPLFECSIIEFVLLKALEGGMA